MELPVGIQLAENGKDVIPVVRIRKGKEPLILDVRVYQRCNVNHGIIHNVDIVLRRLVDDILSLASLEPIPRSLYPLQRGVIVLVLVALQRSEVGIGQHRIEYEPGLVFSHPFPSGLLALRLSRVVHSQAPLEPLVRWRSPCVTYRLLVPRVLVDDELEVGLRRCARAQTRSEHDSLDGGLRGGGALYVECSFHDGGDGGVWIHLLHHGCGNVDETCRTFHGSIKGTRDTNVGDFAQRYLVRAIFLGEVLLDPALVLDGADGAATAVPGCEELVDDMGSDVARGPRDHNQGT